MQRSHKNKAPTLSSRGWWVLYYMELTAFRYGIDGAALVHPFFCRAKSTLGVPEGTRRAVAQQKRATSPKEMTFYAIWPRMSKLTGPYCIKKPPLLRRLSFVVLGMGFEPMISRMRILRPGPARRTELVPFWWCKDRANFFTSKKKLKKNLVFDAFFLQNIPKPHYIIYR